MFSLTLEFLSHIEPCSKTILHSGCTWNYHRWRLADGAPQGNTCTSPYGFQHARDVEFALKREPPCPQVESVLECPSSWPLQSTSSLEPQQRPGTLHLTPHHLVFNYSSKIQNDQDKQKDLWLPIPLILSLTLHPPSSAALTPLVARTRDFRVHTLLFRDHTKAQQVYDSVKALVNSATLQSLHAFAQPPAEPYGPGEGWHVYDHKKELERMGALGERSQAWRTTDVNAAYEFCDTYPAALTIPTKISDPTLKYGKSYRSKFRIPALVYLHWANLVRALLPPFPVDQRTGGSRSIICDSPGVHHALLAANGRPQERPLHSR